MKHAKRKAAQQAFMRGKKPIIVATNAFGLGIERIALLKYHIDDMRLLYENDIRFISQF